MTETIGPRAAVSGFLVEGEREVELTVKAKHQVFAPTYNNEKTEKETLRLQWRQNPDVTRRFSCQFVDLGITSK